jgi:hypothetical protein
MESPLEILSRAALNVQEHEGELVKLDRDTPKLIITYFLSHSVGAEQVTSQEEAFVSTETSTATKCHTESSTTDAI